MKSDTKIKNCLTELLTELHQCWKFAFIPGVVLLFAAIVLSFFSNFSILVVGLTFLVALCMGMALTIGLIKIDLTRILEKFNNSGNDEKEQD